MYAEIRRKIKASLLLLMLAAAEVRHVQQRAFFSGLRSGGSASTRSSVAANSSASVERATHVVEQMMAMVDDPNLQGQAKRLGEQVKAMASDPVFQEQATRLAEEMDVSKADPNIQKHAKRIGEQIEMMLADPKLQEQANVLAEEFEAMRADPRLQEHASRIAKQMEAMQANTNKLEQAHVLAEQVQALKADPNFQERARRIVEQMDTNPTLKEHAKRVVQEIKALMLDANSKEQVNRISKQIEAMMANPSLQEQARLLAEKVEAMTTQNLHDFHTLAKRSERTGARVQNSKEKSTENLADKLADRLVDQALKQAQWQRGSNRAYLHRTAPLPPRRAAALSNPITRPFGASKGFRQISAKSQLQQDDTSQALSADGLAQPSGVQQFFFPEKETLPDDVEMPIWDHLEELRERVLLAGFAAIFAIIVCFFFAKDLIVFLEAPILDKGVKFLQLSPGEFLFTTLKVSGYSGLLLSLPTILYQIGAWVTPGLTVDEKKFLTPVFLGSFILFLSGIFFSYSFLAPAALNFFVSFAEGAVESLYSIDQYFEFILLLMISAGLSFQIPIVQILLGQIGVVNSEKIFSSWKYAMVGSTVIAAFLTPSTDPFTQILLTIPLVGLYLGGGLALKLIEEGQQKQPA